MIETKTHSRLCVCAVLDWNSWIPWPTNFIFRPPDIVVGGLWFYRDSFSFFFFFFSCCSSVTTRARWTELNQNRPHARTWVRFENVCSKCGVSLPYKSKAPKPLFRGFCNLAATLTDYIIGTKDDIHNRVRVLETTQGFLRPLKMSWTLAHKRLKIGLSFYLLSTCDSHRL